MQDLHGGLVSVRAKSAARHETEATNAGIPSKGYRRNSRRAIAIAAVLVALLPAESHAAVTAAQKCEGGKNDASGKYAACMAKAEKSLIFGGTIEAYDSAQMKCAEKHAGTWTKLEGGGSCPTTSDDSSIQGFLDACVQSVAEALGGGTLPRDAVTCNADLADCLSDCVTSVRPPFSTGQTTSYGAGSDGDLEKGAGRSFTDNGDGTITDNVSGLMWEKKSDDGSIHDKDNSYSWSTGTDNMDGTMVTTFLATLNGNSGFAGHTDWRIPNRNELLTLTNLEAVGPATYSAFNAGCAPACTVTTCSCTRSYDYWSSSTYQGNPSDAWRVDFIGGYTFFNDETNWMGVRAVRAGS